MRDLNRFGWDMLLQFQRTNRLLRLNQFRDNSRIGWNGMGMHLRHRTEAMFGEQAAWREWLRRRLSR